MGNLRKQDAKKKWKHYGNILAILRNKHSKEDNCGPKRRKKRRLETAEEELEAHQMDVEDEDYSVQSEGEETNGSCSGEVSCDSDES